MNSLIITNTHILFGDWSSNKDKYILNDLKYIALSKPIKEVLKSQNSIRTVLKEALDKFPTKGNQVAIAIDDELLFHDKFASEESLTKREIWDYIQWETKQKWGELGSYYTTFAEIDSPNPNALHSITCPAFLITEIKALITSQGGKLIWAGPVSTIYLENSQYRNAIYMIDDDSYIKFFYRGRDGYSEGKLRFIAGQPSITVGIGDKEEQTSIFKSPNDAREFISIDVSDAKNTYLRQYRHKRIVPFDSIDVKVDDVPEDVSFRSLNALSIMIRDFSFDNLVDFFNPAKIQDRKYTGIGKLSFDREGQRNDDDELVDKKTKKTVESKIRNRRTAQAQAKKDSIDKKKAEKLKAKKDRADKKKAERLQAKKERAKKARAKKDSIDKRRAEKEQAKIDRADKKKADKEKTEKERVEKAQAKKDLIDKKKAERLQAKIDRADKKKADREQAKKEHVKIDKAVKKEPKKQQIEKDETDIKKSKTKKVVKEKTPKDKAEKTKPSTKKFEKNKRKEVNIFPFLVLILLVLLSYYLFFTEGGRDKLSDLKEKIGLMNAPEESVDSSIFDQQFNQSALLINAYSSLTSIVSPDSIIAFKLVDTSGSIEFVGTDSLDIPNFEFTHYSVDPIDCCGGIKQSVDFNIIPSANIKLDIWLSKSEVINQLQYLLGINKIRQLDVISENGIKYNPIIFEVDSLSQIDKTMQYLKFAGDNVIVRKIDIKSTPPTINYSSKFYIAVFEPL